MKTGILHTAGLALFALLTLGACAARAQEPPPPPTLPPPTQPPAQPPATEPPPPAPATPVIPQTPPMQPTSAPTPAPGAQAPNEPAVSPRAELTEGELRRRRDAIYLMEGLLVNTVKLAATRAQSEIKEAVPDLSVTVFSAIPPQANGFHLDDYGVVFNVLIPTYEPSVVNIISMMPRRSESNAQPTAANRLSSGELLLNPDAMDSIYVKAVRDGLIDAMLKFGQSLDLRPSERMAIVARGAYGGPGPVYEPSVLVLHVKGSDLNEFLAGRLTREDVEKRVQMRPYSGRR